MSSPPKTPADDGRFADGPLQRLLDDDVAAAAMRHLLDEGEATVAELTTVASEALAEGPPTDHDRVRAAVRLQVDHLPALEAADLVTVSRGTVGVAFLPTSTIAGLRDVLA